MPKPRATTQRNRPPVKNFRFLTMFRMTYEWKPETMKTGAMNTLNHLNKMTPNPPKRQPPNLTPPACVKTTYPAPTTPTFTKPTPGIIFRRPAGQDPRQPVGVKTSFPAPTGAVLNAGQDPRQPVGVKTSFPAPTGAGLNQTGLKYARR